MQTIKKLGFEDVYHLGIVLDEDFIKKYGIVEKDEFDLNEEQFLKEVRE